MRDLCGFTPVSAFPPWAGMWVTTVPPLWGKAGLEWHQERESSCCGGAEVAKSVLCPSSDRSHAGLPACPRFLWDLGEPDSNEGSTAQSSG